MDRRTGLTRRVFLGTASMGALAFTAPGAFAEELVRTPKQTEGPFYPDKLPLDTDNDLIVLNDSLTPAVGEITHLSGRILGPNGEPIRNAVVEIWQCDNQGNYIHTKGANPKRPGTVDTYFQGFGRFLTGSSGEYYFRTIKPVPYTGRAPHVHFAVKMKGREKWTTQCYIKGDRNNLFDSVLHQIKDPKQKASVLVDFSPIKDSKIGELAAKFDIVMGFTPS